jgi:hypothetical protein
MIGRLLKWIFTRKQRTISDPESQVQRWDRTPPAPKESTQSTLPMVEEHQRSLEEWGVWKE